MNSRLFILFILIGIVGVAHAATEYYPRPWENSTWMEENEYFEEVFGVGVLYSEEAYTEEQKFLIELIFNETLPSLGESLDQLRLQQLDGELRSAGESDANIQMAIKKKNDAEKIEDPSFLETIAGPNFWRIGWYNVAWVGCADYSLLALESYGKEVNGQRALFEVWRGKLIDGGACDDDYVGRAIEYCEMPLEDVECNCSEIWQDIPQFNWYYGCVQEHWNATAALKSRVLAIETAYNESAGACKDAQQEAAEKKAKSDEKFKAIEDEELGKIYPSGSEMDYSGAEGIRGAYKELGEIRVVGDSGFSLADTAEGSTGWLKDCFMGSRTAIAAYEAIIQSSILTEAQELVDDYREEAWEQIHKVEEKESELGALGKKRLDTARDACTAGDSGTLGNRFEGYCKCIKYAKMAEERLEESEGIDEAQLDASLSWLDGFLKRAEEDGIDTEYERIEYSIMEKNKIFDESGIENIKRRILNKAEAVYGELPQRRSGLKETIALGGAQFAYLNSWFDVGEECYSGDELDYSCALGRLHEMQESYDAIENDLWAKKSTLVQDSIIISNWLSWGVPTLDEKGEIYLYVDITNPTNFDAEDIMVEVPTELEFRKIDLVSGSGYVRMVTPKKDKIEIYLTGINASKGIHLVFKKDEIVCRSEDYEVVAYGDSDGGATVTETLDINCKYAVSGLILGETWDVESIAVDGLGIAIGGEGIERELSKGKHILVIESYDYDAYEVEREPSFVSSIGQTTKVELFFNFEPNRDLKYIAYSSVEAGKDLDKLDVFGYTGEKISDKKLMGESTVFFKVYNLVDGKEAKVRVSYEISDLEEYVNQEILYYSGQNLTTGEDALLNEAKNYLLSDEGAEAYKRIEELRSSVEKRAKKHSSVLEKHEKIKEKIEAKISSLESAMLLAQQLGIENTYVSEMGARLNELKNALGLEVEEGALIGPLENIDMGWEKKELTKISKGLLSLEKDLKEGWAEININDAKLSAAIEVVEEKNSRFAGTLSFEDAISAFYALEAGDEILEKLGAGKAEQELGAKAILDGKILKAEDLLEGYAREYEEADGTHLEGLFRLKPSKISKDLNTLSKTTDYSKATDEVEEIIEKMAGTMALLEEEEKLLEENVEALYYELKGKMGELDSDFINAAIQNARGYVAKGKYVQAIKSLEDALTRMDSLEEGDDGIIILAITGLLVLGIIALYLLRDQIPRDILPLQQKKEKPYKRLKREI